MKDYNGWKNWDTWQVSLWVNGERSTYKAKQEFIRSVETVDAANVEQFVRELMPAGTPDMENKYTASKGNLRRKPDDPYHKVDWQEIAEHWAEEKE